MMKTNTTMKTTMCAIAATLALSAFANDDLEKLLTALEDGDYAAERIVETEDFQKVLSTTNDSKTVSEKVKMAMLLHKMSHEYDRMQHLQKNIEERKAKIAEESLPEDAVAQLSAAAQEYYARQIKGYSNDLTRVMLEVKEMKLKWTDETVAGFEYWKQRQADKETVRKMEEKLRRERSERDDKVREEIEIVRRRNRRISCEFKDGSICWDGHCYESMSAPEHCSQKIKECDENLKTMRANLAGLERMKEDRFSKLSPLAQKKFHDKLFNLKHEIEETEFKKKKYEEFWVAKKWSSMSTWKKQHDAEEMKKKRQQAEEALAEAELKLSLIQAAEEVGETYEEHSTRNRWF